MTSLAAMIAERIAEEQRARAKLDQFAERLFSSAEALVEQLNAEGVSAECRRGPGEGNHGLELRAKGIPERIVLVPQRGIAHVFDHPGPHGALYAFVVTEGSTVGVAVERFLVSVGEDVHCDGVCAPAQGNDPSATLQRLVDAVWAEGRQFWAPFESMRPDRADPAARRAPRALRRHR